MKADQNVTSIHPGRPQLPLRQREQTMAGRCHRPILQFTPYAWAKCLWFRDQGNTEIGGFGISAADDLMLIEDFVTVGQQVSAVSVEFDDQAVADFFDRQVDEGRRPEQFARIWLHTHPGNSALPSGTDEQTFSRVFGACDFAIMAIVARGGQTYGRLKIATGPGVACRVRFNVDYGRSFPATDMDVWEDEYHCDIHSVPEHVGLFDWREEFPDDRRWLDQFCIGDEAAKHLDSLSEVGGFDGRVV